LAIAAVGISGIIQPVGVTKANAMAVPTNIHFAGWYAAGAKPGQPGLGIIDGHVSGSYGDGLFKRLAQVKAGDTIEIEFGNHSVERFRVRTVTTVAQNKAAAQLFARLPDVKSQLNLITCGGTYSPATHTFSDRVIVAAVPDGAHE
jgi:sortase (surface protein transpeptidase)